MQFLFRPPTVEEKHGRRGLFARTHLPVGITLLKEDGFYRQVRDPDPAIFDQVDLFYLGGHDYLVSEDESNALIAAGYTTIPVSEDFGGGAFGAGPFGGGAYGF